MPQCVLARVRVYASVRMPVRASACTSVCQCVSASGCVHACTCACACICGPEQMAGQAVHALQPPSTQSVGQIAASQLKSRDILIECPMSMWNTCGTHAAHMQQCTCGMHAAYIPFGPNQSRTDGAARSFNQRTPYCDAVCRAAGRVTAGPGRPRRHTAILSPHACVRACVRVWLRDGGTTGQPSRSAQSADSSRAAHSVPVPCERMFVCALAGVCVHVHACMSVRAYMRARACVRACASQCASVCACLHTCLLRSTERDRLRVPSVPQLVSQDVQACHESTEQSTGQTNVLQGFSPAPIRMHARDMRIYVCVVRAVHISLGWRWTWCGWWGGWVGGGQGWGCWRGWVGGERGW